MSQPRHDRPEAGWPKVTVIMPVLNEAGHLEDAVAAILGQRYPGPLEVVLAVGPSHDGTERVAHQLAEVDPRVQVVDNPSGRTPSALNRAIAAATGTVIARIDAHSEPTPDYLHTAVSLLLETGADNVGGRQHAVGQTPFQRAVAAAMSSRFGVGDARFHYGGDPGPVDTVYLGVFRREVLEQLGGYDESLARNQDYELNYRIRRAGGTVYFDPRLEVVYRPRATLRSLAGQYWQYGQWKRVVATRHPGSIRWRHLVAPVTVLANATALVAGTRWRLPLAIPSFYLAATAGAAIIAAPDVRTALRLLIVFPTMHHSWGAGFLVGQRRNSSELDRTRTSASSRD